LLYDFENIPWKKFVIFASSTSSRGEGDINVGGTLNILKAILESVPAGYLNPWEEVRPGKDQILRELSASEVTTHEELCSLEADLRTSLRKSLRYIQLFEAKRFLFKDLLRSSAERAESTEIRGRFLDIKKTLEGVPVLVETPKEELD